VSLAGPTARIVDGEQVEYVFHNNLGHLLAATDEAGFLKAGFTYSPFGELIRGAGTEQDAFTRRFNDKESDEVTGLSYYGARYYDPDTLTWTQGDPLFRFAPDADMGSPRRTTLYAFSLNNPLRYVDPDGQNPDGRVDTMVAHRVREHAAGRLDTRAGLARGTVSGVAVATGFGAAASVVPVVGDPIAAGVSVGVFVAEPSWTTFGDLVLDAVGAAVPVVPALGTARRIKRLATSADKARDTYKAVGAADAASDGAKAAKAKSPTAGKKVDAKTRQRVLERDRNPDGTWNCGTCGHPTANPDNIHTGHIEPRSHGGDLSDGNLRCEGAACNLSQGNRPAPKPDRTCAARGSCGAPYGRTD
jgi:RHS repeat-associated protein